MVAGCYPCSIQNVKSTSLPTATSESGRPRLSPGCAEEAQSRVPCSNCGLICGQRRPRTHTAVFPPSTSTGPEVLFIAHHRRGSIWVVVPMREVLLKISARLPGLTVSLIMSFHAAAITVLA
ncbi:hypothetical protein BD626DRAFT_496173 [Schizophyllum amplum]|uniref:Uncharacterized protein n=1 Tax=Schizophyllum amplum TaxID=97359 RepID=A0A550CET1_9AGAR|nr:hypothetical protein BD626DRAFT_496173 [Auriculariopsis ampla]